MTVGTSRPYFYNHLWPETAVVGLPRQILDKGKRMSSIYRAALASLAEKIERHRNKPFLEAMMSATALLAMADQEIVLSQRLALDFILENVKDLKVFDVHQAINLFRDYSKAAQQDFNKAREGVL